MADNFAAGIIDRWTLPWPEIHVPSYRGGRLGAWELKRQFQCWARTLGVPIAAYDNRAWRERIPNVATQLIFGGSPAVSGR